jgi:biopolymer transport protein ExbD
LNIRSQKKEELDVNVTPLIDVVFLLLIFFMVSTTFERQSQIDVTLPKASINEPVKEDRTIEVTVNPEGVFFVNGQRVVNTQLATLKQAMLKVANGREDPPVIINADRNAQVQSMVTVMDAARQLGFVHISFATSRTNETQ